MNIICVFIFLIISLLLIVNFKCTFMVVSACSMVLGCMNGVGPLVCTKLFQLLHSVFLCCGIFIGRICELIRSCSAQYY